MKVYFIKTSKLSNRGNVRVNITVRGTLQTILALEKQELLHITSVCVA